MPVRERHVGTLGSSGSMRSRLAARLPPDRCRAASLPGAGGTILLGAGDRILPGAGGRILLLLVMLLLPVIGAGQDWCGDTLAQQVERADLVVRAGVVSRSRVEGGRYWATFRVDRLLHVGAGEQVPKFLRLEVETRASGGQGCRAGAKVKPSGKYLVMVKKQGETQALYGLSSPPLKSTKKLVREAKRILSGYQAEESRKVRVRRGKAPSPRAPSPRVHQTTRLSCSARGNPPPTLYWTVDGRVLENSPATRILTKNLSKFLRKSVLKLRGSVQQSAVHLQCHAFNSYGHTSKVKMGRARTSRARDSSRRHRTPRPAPPSPTPPRARADRRGKEGLRAFRGGAGSRQGGRLLGPAASPLLSSSCPIPDYCMNGGSCRFYSALGEQTCQCAKGYRGKRCERKYVSTGNLGAGMSDRFPLCLLGMAHYPCQ